MRSSSKGSGGICCRVSEVLSLLSDGAAGCICIVKIKFCIVLAQNIFLIALLRKLRRSGGCVGAWGAALSGKQVSQTANYLIFAVIWQ